jgi:S-adenosylmethionine synthetase
MGASITGGGIHGKDLSKADVSINIYAFLKAQETKKIIKLSCAIGDEFVDGKKYSEIIDIAKKYINKVGGFEKMAEWGFF